jgi:hypothetical protein|tara:strand:- start:103 stop:255 length:153 start_codon:yes stop_codon:yes gene_type:complete
MIRLIILIAFFVFFFSRGLDVLTRSDNHYSIEYSGPDTTTEHRWNKARGE